MFLCALSVPFTFLFAAVTTRGVGRAGKSRREEGQRHTVHVRGASEGSPEASSP